MADAHPHASPPAIAVRKAVQFGFALSALLTGFQFFHFLATAAAPALPAVPRPEAVEAWLPISSLMSLVLLLKTGVASPVHPAGLVLFSLILVLSACLRRGFCSWVCPLGTASELLHGAGRRLFSRNLRMPPVADVALRAVKFAVLAFFAVVICRMSAEELLGFIEGPYNRLCDRQMALFFARASGVTFVVLAALAALSVLFKNFVCRYLCPYGALLGLASLLSPAAVRRTASRCTQCGACSKACASGIDVPRRTTVRSPECTACLECVQACPHPEALRFGAARGSRVTPLLYAGILCAAFILVPQLFRAFGYWTSDTPASYYRPGGPHAEASPR